MASSGQAPITRAPVVWSHCNAFSLCDHPRNVPDDVLDRVKGNGGIVMATFVPTFINQAMRDWYRPFCDAWGKARPLAPGEEKDLQQKAGPLPSGTLEQLVVHIEYLAARAGLAHVGIGSDFFGGRTPDGLEHVATSLGFERAAAPPPLAAPWGDYEIPVLGAGPVATIAAGLLGAAAAFLVAWFVARRVVPVGVAQASAHAADAGRT